MNERHDTLRAHSIYLPLIALGGLLALWIAFAKLVVPPLIERSYRGESLSILNRMIRGQAAFPIDHYLRVWDTVVPSITIALAGFGLVGVIMFEITSSRSFFRKYVGAATPGTLGALRMLTCLVLLLTTLLEDLSSVAMLPPEARAPHGLMRLVYALPIGFERLVASEVGLWVFQLLTEVTLFLGVLGWRSRIVIPLGAACHFLMGGILRDYSFDWHQGWIPLYLMAILSFTPCGDGWSVDRLRRVYGGRSVPEPDRALAVYGWSRYLCWAAIALPYVESGLSKLRYGGLSWWSASNMRNFLYTETLRPREFDWRLSLYLAPAPDIVFSLLGFASVVGEVAFGLVLFSGRARRILPIAMIMMHVGILILQRILFIDLILLQLAFIDWTEVRRRIGQWLAVGRGQVEVRYDGSSPVWCRTMRLVACLDLFARLQYLDHDRVDSEGRSSAESKRELRVIRRGHAYRGFAACRVIALTLPVFWVLAPLLFLPGVSWLGTAIYRYVAFRPAHSVAPGSRDAIERSPGGSGPGSPVEVDRCAYRLRFPAVLSGWALASILCWYYLIEYYPLTSWHLFATHHLSSRITYYRVVARFASGERAPMRLEDGIGAMRFDARYDPFLAMCFGKPHPRHASPEAEDAHVCRKFLAASAAAYNRTARPGAQVTQLEIQAWDWDFGSNPSDPEYGRLVDRFVFDVEPERHP